MCFEKPVSVLFGVHALMISEKCYKCIIRAESKLKGYLLYILVCIA